MFLREDASINEPASDEHKQDRDNCLWCKGGELLVAQKGKAVMDTRNSCVGKPEGAKGESTVYVGNSRGAQGETAVHRANSCGAKGELQHTRVDVLEAQRRNSRYAWEILVARGGKQCEFSWCEGEKLKHKRDKGQSCGAKKEIAVCVGNSCGAQGELWYARRILVAQRWKTAVRSDHRDVVLQVVVIPMKC